MKVYIETNNGE
jgi:Ubiquitin family